MSRAPDPLRPFVGFAHILIFAVGFFAMIQMQDFVSSGPDPIRLEPVQRMIYGFAGGMGALIGIYLLANHRR